LQLDTKLLIEYCQLGTLMDHVGTFSVKVELCLHFNNLKDALKIAFQLGLALAYLQSNKILHRCDAAHIETSRDVKPDNVGIDGHGVIKLLDLGCAASGLEHATKEVGTDGFCAPGIEIGQFIDRNP
jgi:serine/threonine protein kinase